MVYRKLKTIFRLLLILSLVLAAGLFFDAIKVFAAGPTVSASISAQSQQGSNGWYVTGVTVTITAIPNGTNVRSITFWLDSNTPLTVNADTTTQTFSQNGSHTLYYYATDINGVQGSTGLTPFKIDTVSPVNWSNITQTRNGNAHTFQFSASVTDNTAGLDPSLAYMQYNVDNTGATWGYYSNLLQCSSNWIPNQWYRLPTQSFVSGATSGTITTPPVDYCTSSGNNCDFMKLRIYDIAGNFSDKKICLGGPWLQTQAADVYSRSSITMTSDAPQANTSYIVGSQSSIITAFTSAKAWYMPSYSSDINLSTMSYLALNGKYGTSALSLPSGQLPTSSGYYRVSGDFTVNPAVLPPGYATAKNFATVILVDGTLTINTNITTDPSSVLVIVAKNAINVEQNVTALSGVFIAGGLFDSSYNGNADKQLVVKGSVYSQGGFNLPRSLEKTANKTTPAELFVYQPQYLLNTNLVSLLTGTVRIDWREVAP